MIPVEEVSVYERVIEELVHSLLTTSISYMGLLESLSDEV